MLDVQVPKKYVLNSLQWNLKLTFYCKGRQGKMLRLKLDPNVKQMHFSNIIIPNYCFIWASYIWVSSGPWVFFSHWMQFRQHEQPWSWITSVSVLTLSNQQ